MEATVSSLPNFEVSINPSTFKSEPGKFRV